MSYFGNTGSLIIGFLLAAAILGDEASVWSIFDSSSLLLLIIPTLFNAMAFTIPFWVTIIYAILGADWWAVYWVDDVLLFLIEHWISNYNMFAIIFTLYIMFYAISSRTKQMYDVTAVIYGVLALMFEYMVIIVSTNAIRYIDPTW